MEELIWSEAARGRVVDCQCKQLSDALPEHNLIILVDFDVFWLIQAAFVVGWGGTL